MPPCDRRSLWDLIAATGLPDRRFVADADGRVALRDLAGGTSFACDPTRLRGKSVLISADRQLPAMVALAELDGVARRLVLCPPDAQPAHMQDVMAEAGVDAVATDGTGPAAELAHGVAVHRFDTTIRRAAPRDRGGTDTEWLLFTSGTTARPKLVVHTLPSLTGPLDDGLAITSDAIWSTFYDIRRYGGLQILLRACLCGGSMVLSQAGEPVGDFLTRAGADGVTHISGTPSHWRRALMSARIGRLTPRYVRLSGEVADQPILNSLGAAFPSAGVAHAFASTEAGVAFDVRDGLAGFPAALIDQPGAAVEMRVRDGSLLIRSARTALRYAGGGGALADADGFVDTGDMLVLRDGRYYFVGRREGIVNVGGQKVHPEEVEAVINQHPDIRMSRVWGRASPITGAIVVADIVTSLPDGTAPQALKDEILETCRRLLPAHKVPAILRAVPTIALGAGGKLARPRA